MSGSPPEVSFVVIAHNEAANIVSCLSALSSQTEAPSIEVVVVDDGSQDETAALVTRFGADRPGMVTLLQHTVNRGRGAARQTGLNAAQGQLIAMVDADVVLPADWLRRCATALADGGESFRRRYQCRAPTDSTNAGCSRWSVWTRH